MRVAKNPKQVCKFLRNKLKLPGKTYHEGRGYQIMEHRSTPERMVPALHALAAKYDFISIEVSESGIITLQFADLVPNEGIFGSSENYYRCFMYNPTTNELVNTM